MESQYHFYQGCRRVQGGCAVDYGSLEAFQSSVKENKFDYDDEKLRYTSEADDYLESWTNSPNFRKSTAQPSP